MKAGQGQEPWVCRSESLEDWTVATCVTLGKVLCLFEVCSFLVSKETGKDTLRNSREKQI